MGLGFGLPVWGFGFLDPGFWFRASGVGLGASGFGLRSSVAEFGVSASKYKKLRRRSAKSFLLRLLVHSR